MKQAHELLQSLRDFGWPLLAYAVLGFVATYLIPSIRSREDRTAKFVLVGSIIALIEAFFFLATEGGDLVEVMDINRSWGGCIILLAIVAIGIAGIGWSHRVTEGRQVVSVTMQHEAIGSPLRHTYRRSYLALCVVWLAGAVGVVIWLAVIASPK